MMTLILASFSIISTSLASALEYRSNTVNVSFTFEPILTLTTSGNINMSVTPGTKVISDNYPVTVDTNNAAGYTLSATVGCSNDSIYSGINCDNTTNLTNNTSYFSMIESNTTLSPSVWGINTETNPTVDSNFKPIALYTDSATILNKTTNAEGTGATGYIGGSTTPLRVGAYASSSQIAGAYRNVVNFTAVANVVAEQLYMQDLTLSQCMVNVGTNGNEANIGDNITVYDKRDGNSYTVRYINGQCWMTKNLRITGIISSKDSNFTGTDFNVSEYSLDSNDASYTDHCDSTNGYLYPCSKESTDPAKGVWYNYCAASAGTICSSSNSTNTTEDICPAGWHLPTGPNTVSGRDFNTLVGNTTSSSQDPTPGLTAFGVVSGGNYTYGSLYNTEKGYWWSATTTAGTIYRYNLSYDSRNDQFRGSDSYYKYGGYYIRCVKDNYMQEQTASTLSKLMPSDGDSTTLVDKRDGNSYTVKKINGQYWMTQNLRVTGTITAELSNFTGNDFNVSQYSLDSNDASYTDHCDDTNSYSYPCSKVSTDTSYGAWYNYCAATAGTICSSSNDTNATQDICPAGWKLPTGPNTVAGSNLNTLVGNTTSGWQDATEGLTAFSAVSGGRYYNGALVNTEFGYWWSTTNGSSAVSRYLLYYYSNSGQFLGKSDSYRYYGDYIRCVFGT